jgi:hypothetical protein
MRKLLSLAALILFLPACYHATIETGRPSSGTVINKPFRPSFVYGLVPPPTLNTATECPNGVAKVETYHSFVEGLVSVLTFSLFTPMTYKVTCASAGAMGALPEGTIKLGTNATAAEKEAALQLAAERSHESGAPVYVKF